MTQRRGRQAARLARLGLLAIPVAAVAAAAWFTLPAQHFPLRQVVVSGELRQLDEAEVRSLLSDGMQAGFFRVDLNALRATLLRNPWVQQASVRRLWPDALHVRIREQVPVAAWGRQGFVNAAGDHLVLDGAPEHEELPVLHGPPGTQRLLLERMRAVDHLLAPAGTRVSALFLSERRSWRLSLDNGWRVFLGSHNVDERIDMLHRVVLPAMRDQWHQVEVVDMRYTSGYAIRRRQPAAAAAVTDAEAW